MQSAAAEIPRPQLEREHRYLELLVRAGEILSTALDWHETINGVCEAAVQTVADICLLALADSDLYLAASAHRDRTLAPLLRCAGEFLPERTRAEHPAAIVVRTGRPILVPQIDEAYLTRSSTSPEHEQFMRRMEYRSLIVVPLISKTQGTIGALTLVRTRQSEERYDEEVLRFARDLATRCATAIAKSRLYEQSRHIATVYQRAALPARLPKRTGIHFDAYYEPSSEELLVGGDWYDAFELEDGRLAITVGDVLGHGIDAATWMSRLRNGFRAALFGDPDPARALEIADKMMRAESREDFTTALVALIDPTRETLSCASAGHPGPLLWNGTGRIVDPFRERGLPLGLRDLGESARTSQTLALHPGSFLVFFTDGLLEWDRDFDRSWTRLEEAMCRHEIREAARPAKAIRDDVIGTARHEDDVAILTMRWEITHRPR